MTDVRRERIPLLWSTVREIALAKGFCSNLGDTKYPCVCRRTELSGRGVHSEKVRELDWSKYLVVLHPLNHCGYIRAKTRLQEIFQRRRCD